MPRTLSRRALFAGPLLTPLASGPAAGQDEVAPATAATVPMFRGNPARTGEHPGPGPAGEPARRWLVRLGKVLTSSPAVANGIVYVGSVSPGTLAGGALHAVDAISGVERWRLPTVPGDGIFASPAVVDGIVVVGSYDGIVAAAAAATGEERWRFQAETTFYSSPALVDGVAYLADDGGRLYALAAATGEERWRFVAGSGFERTLSSPAVVEGTVYSVSASRRVGETAFLLALDAATGEERWRFTPDDGGSLGGTAVVAGGRVYAALRENMLYAVDAHSGEERRRYDLGVVQRAQLAVVDGVAYLGTAGGELHAVDVETGQRRWSRRLTGGAALTSSPTVAAGTVYVGDAEGIVHAVAAASGEKRWQVAARSLLSSPAIVGGALYVGGNDGALRAFGERDKQVPPLR